jgi:hypothetical protein
MVLLDITSWWADKVLFEQIFWVLAIPATVAMFFILVTTFLGGDGVFEGSVDASVDLDAGAGFQFFTLKNLIGFFAIFGWVGIGCVSAGMEEFSTLVIASICGLSMMGIMGTIFFFVSRLVEDGSFKMKNALGRLGEIYLPVPAGGSGLGKVQITVQGAVREIDAMTYDDTIISTGAVVRVLDIIDGHILLVSKQIPNKP